MMPFPFGSLGATQGAGMVKTKVKVKKLLSGINQGGRVLRGARIMQTNWKYC
jgi:hypothetical protein